MTMRKRHIGAGRSSRHPGCIIVLLVAALSGPAGGVDVQSACETQFRTTVQPILNTNCVACHQDAAPADGLSLQRTSAPANLLNKKGKLSPIPLITPGSPDRSYLYLKIAGRQAEVGGAGQRMPFGRVLSEADIAQVSDWITQCKAG